MRNFCKADICRELRSQAKSFVHLFKGGGCPEGKALGRSPQRAKLLKLTAKSLPQQQNHYKIKKLNSHFLKETCPTTEAALQTGLLPAQERRKGCFAKALGRLKKVLVGRILVSDIRRSPDACSANKCRIRESDLRLMPSEQQFAA